MREFRNTDQNPDSPWQQCAAGQLRELSDDVRRRVQRRQLAKAMGVAAAVAMVLVIGAQAWNGAAPAATLECDEVMPLLTAYQAGTLSSTVRRQVEAHLDICPQCRAEVERRGESRQGYRSGGSRRGQWAQRADTAPQVAWRRP